MGVLNNISIALQAHRELTGRRETYADYRRIIYEQSSGRLSLTSIYSDLERLGKDSYAPTEGDFIFFKYNPKYKKILSIYDIYPLVYVFGPTMTVEVGGYAFFGANLHYINKSKTGGIRNRQYARGTIIKAFDHEEIENTDFYRLMEELTTIFYKNRSVNLVSHAGASLFHKYINKFLLTNYYRIPEKFVNIMLFLDLERFVTR